MGATIPIFLSRDDLAEVLPRQTQGPASIADRQETNPSSPAQTVFASEPEIRSQRERTSY